MKDELDLFFTKCYTASCDSGWWTNLETGEPISVHALGIVGEKLMLIVSEVAEAMEGYRKDNMDSHLPHRKAVEVELADAVIRIGCLAGALGLDLAGAIQEKMAYNAQREDHKIQNRKKNNGKKF